MTQIAERDETYVTTFDAFRRDPAFGPGSVRRAREAAFARFLDRGFPSTREEEWRFTSVAPIAAQPFDRADPALPSRSDVASFLVDGAGVQVVVVNGRVSKTLSSIHPLPAGVTVETLADVLGRDDRDATMKAVLNGRPQPQRGPFVDLNEAFYEDLVMIRVAPKTRVDAPIHVLSVTTQHDRPVLVSPRVSIHVGEGAEVSVVETYAGLQAGTTLTSAVTEINVAPGAVVDHVKVQREADSAFHMANLAVWLDRASTFTSHALTFGGRIARNDISAVLDGEGAECTLNGLYVATGDSLVDTHTLIDHAKPHCPSHEIYKGILGGKARAVFNGKIIVRPDAQKTDAKQTNRALLLTDDAQVNTKPQLEIFADDVKCTHGAAIGQLDEDAMFYLRARGIDDRAGRIMLIHAFAGQVLEGVKSPAVRTAAMHLVDQKLSIE